MLVPFVAVGIAAAGAFATPAATGLSGLDLALRAGLGGGIVLLVIHARPWMVALAAGVALVGAGGAGPGAALAAVSLGMMVGATAARLDVPFLNSLAGGLAVQAALRLDGSSTPRVTAYAAGLTLAILIVAGALTLPRRTRRVVMTCASGTLGVAVTAGLLGLLAAAVARPAVEDGIRSASAGLDSARRGEGARAADELSSANKSFREANSHLDAWWARPALAVPGVALQSRALRAMATSGAELSHSGARAAGAADTKDLHLSNGTIPLDRIKALQGPARDAFSSLVRADAQLSDVHSPWLVSPIATRLASLSTRVTNARAGVRSASVAFDLLPALLGGDGPRHYFLAVQTPAEQRASGGIIGNFGEIGADGGRLTLDRVGRDAELNAGGNPATRKLIAPPDYTARYSRFDVNLLWQNITMSPDFPTVARAIAGMYPQSGGRDIDGVISIDPIGLAALLKVVGPIEVKNWPEPITGDNAAQILLYDQYLKLDLAPRVAFLGDVTAGVWQRVTTSSASIADLARALGPMVAQRHIMLASTHPTEEAPFMDLGVSGAMAPVHGDFIGVVTQNAGGNKIDWFLRRTIDYQAELNPATGEVHSTVNITLRNDAPASGLPPYVIGNSTTPPVPTGTNRTYLSVYSPLPLAGARVGGEQLLMESELERDRHVYSTYLSIPPGGSVTVELDLVGAIQMRHGYQLGIHRQPFLAPDAVTTSVHVPAGWFLGDSGSTSTRSQSLQLESDQQLQWRLRRAA